MASNHVWMLLHCLSLLVRSQGGFLLALPHLFEILAHLSLRNMVCGVLVTTFSWSDRQGYGGLEVLLAEQGCNGWKTPETTDHTYTLWLFFIITFFFRLLSPTLLCLKSPCLWQWVSSEVWMRPPNLLLKLQRCPAWTSVAELQNAKILQLPRPKASWLLGELDRNLPFCSCDKNMKLCRGDLLHISVLSPEEGWEVKSAACASPATLSQSNMESYQICPQESSVQSTVKERSQSSDQKIDGEFS